MFLLSYESFSILSNIFCQKSVISSQNSYEFLSFLMFCFQLLPEIVVIFIEKNIFHFI